MICYVRLHLLTTESMNTNNYTVIATTGQQQQHTITADILHEYTV